MGLALSAVVACLQFPPVGSPQQVVNFIMSISLLCGNVITITQQDELRLINDDDGGKNTYLAHGCLTEWLIVDVTGHSVVRILMIRNVPCRYLRSIPFSSDFFVRSFDRD